MSPVFSFTLVGLFARAGEAVYLVSLGGRVGSRALLQQYSIFVLLSGMVERKVPGGVVLETQIPVSGSRFVSADPFLVCFRLPPLARWEFGILTTWSTVEQADIPCCAVWCGVAWCVCMCVPVCTYICMCTYSSSCLCVQRTQPLRKAMGCPQ